VVLAGPKARRFASRLDWWARGVVNIGKEVTVCVVVTRGGSSDEQPTGCMSREELIFRASVSQIPRAFDQPGQFGRHKGALKAKRRSSTFGVRLSGCSQKTETVEPAEAISSAGSFFGACKSLGNARQRFPGNPYDRQPTAAGAIFCAGN